VTDHGPAADSTFGIFTVDTRLVVRTWDPWIATVTGVSPEKALNRPLAAVVPELETRGFFDILRAVLDRGTVEVLAPALHQRWIDCPPRKPSARFDRMLQRVLVGPMREDGRITGVAVTVEDVTARMEAERRLADSVETPDAMERMTGALGDQRWTVRQQQVRELAQQGRAIVDTLVKTLRVQHHNFNVLSSLLDLIALADLDVVEPVMACLENDDADLRMQAALILGERHDQRAVPALMRTLDDPDVNVRFHAIEALGRLHATQAVERLVTIAEQRDFFLAFPAVQALALVGDAAVAARLVPLLGDELLSAAVAEALGVLGDDVVAEPLVTSLGEPHAPVDVIAETLAALYERYERRYGAGDQIATVVRRTISATATQNLLDAVQRVSSDRLRGIACVLGWLDGQAVQRALTRLLGQPTIRAQVVEALVRYGSGVVDLLVEQLTAEDLDTRQAAAVALGRIGDRRATAALVAALQDTDLAVPAAGALARIGDAAAFEPLLALIGHDDSAIRQATIAALNSIGHADMPHRVLGLLDDPNALVRESATKIAGYFGYPECLRRLIERCSDPAETVRRAAVEQLPMFDDRDAVDRLVQALAVDTPPVRAAAAAAFAHIEALDAIGPLTRALGDQDPWVRYFALRSLGSFQHPSAAPAVRDCLERDPAGQVRLAAIDVLGRLQPAGVLSILEPLVRSDDADTARAAIRALRHVQDPDAAGTLDAVSRADEGWRRLETVVALGERGGLHAVSTLEWVAAADDSRDVAEAAIAGLATLASRDDEPGAKAAGALVALTAEPSRRESSVAALARLPVRRASDVARGLAHSSPSVRRATVDALSRMRHTDATRWIETALDDVTPAVRSAAAAELRRLGSRHATRKLMMLARTDPDVEVRQAAMMASGWRGSE
jgi:HEAT repeat protein